MKSRANKAHQSDDEDDDIKTDHSSAVATQNSQVVSKEELERR